MKHHRTSRCFRSRPKGRRGAAVVEMAIVAPFLLLLTFGIVELGWFLHLAQVVHNSARHGARTAVSAENSNAQVESAVLSCLSNDAGIDAAAATVQITRLSLAGEEQYEITSLDENEQGQPVRVTVTVDYSGILTNMLGLHGGSLSCFVVMRRQK